VACEGTTHPNTSNTLLSPYYYIPHSPYVRANQAVEGIRHLNRAVALRRSVVGFFWGFSLESSFLSFSVPVPQQQIARGDEPIEFQAEGGRGIAMTEGYSDLALQSLQTDFLRHPGLEVTVLASKQCQDHWLILTAFADSKPGK
jgi:hypothetical protein